VTSSSAAPPAEIPQRKRAQRPGPAANPGGQRISGVFQLGLALYIILTGDFPMIVQALAFGMKGSGGTEFAVAMITSAARDLTLLAPVVILSKHPLGILHPLPLAVVVWPLVFGIPSVIEEFGGWAGVLAGVPVESPFYRGFPTRDASTVWTAIAKYNALQVIALISTYVGFWMFSGRTLGRVAPALKDPAILRTVLIGLLGTSMLVLLAFLYFRGGLGFHLTSLGHGRFRELAGTGPIMVAIDFGAIALYVWIAARPGDVKSPMFLAAFALVTISQFVSNGSRGSALMVPLIVGIIWSLRSRRIPWKVALIFIPIMFASIGLLGAARTAVWSGSTAGEALSTTGWAESFELAQQEIVERRASSANIPVIERGFEVTDGPMYGKTYIAAIAAWIPRALWEGKPRGTGSLYTQLFLGESSEGAGIPVSPEAEMYWNFGLPGVILLSIMYGALLKMAYNFMWRRYPDPFAIVFYVIFVTTFQLSTRELVRSEQQFALLLLCYAFAAFLVPTRRAIGVRARTVFAGRPNRVLSPSQT
jgi:hypothetical protein